MISCGKSIVGPLNFWEDMEYFQFFCNQGPKNILWFWYLPKSFCLVGRSLYIKIYQHTIEYSCFSGKMCVLCVHKAKDSCKLQPSPQIARILVFIGFANWLGLSSRWIISAYLNWIIMPCDFKYIICKITRKQKLTGSMSSYS